VVSFTHRPLYPRETAPSTHWIGGWVGPRAGLDAVVKRKIPSPCGEWNPGRSARSLVTILTELPRLTLWDRQISSCDMSKHNGLLLSTGSDVGAITNWWSDLLLSKAQVSGLCIHVKALFGGTEVRTVVLGPTEFLQKLQGPSSWLSLFLLHSAFPKR
jgi:hypothetical protein